MSSVGQYECLARNAAGSDRRLLFLNASLLVKTNGKSRPKRDKGGMRTDWKLMTLIVGICSFLAGIIALSAVACSIKKFCKKKNDYRNSGCEVVTPENFQVGRGSEKLDSYEEMKQIYHLRSPENREKVLENDGYELPVDPKNCESGYQELSQFREKDEDAYQSLNPK